MTKRQENDLEAVRAAIANGGAMSIYETLLSISSDPTAPAQARVGACATIVRMSGLYEDAKRRPVDDLEAADMSPEEMRRAGPVLKKELARLEAQTAKRKALLESVVVDDEAADPADIFE